LLVLKRLENNYPAAALIHELFSRAKDNNGIPFGISDGLSKNNSTTSPESAHTANTLVDMSSAELWSSAGFDLLNTFSSEIGLFSVEDMNFWTGDIGEGAMH
jgi:hypothetical protein